MQRLIAMLLAILLLSAAGAGYAAEEGSKPPQKTAPAKDDDRLPIHKQDQWQFFSLLICGWLGLMPTSISAVNPLS
jgi:hypothetical protein